MPIKVVIFNTDCKNNRDFLHQKSIKKTPGISWRFSILWAQIFHRAEVLIPVPQIPVCQVEVSVLCHGYAAVAKNPTEGINVHTVHQTAFGKVIPQCMWGIGLIDACSAKIFPETGFKGMDFQWEPRLFGEQELSAGIAIFVPQPALKTLGRFH